MKKFIMLIKGEDKAGWEAMTPEEQQAGVEKYMLFARKLREDGRLVDAEGLDPKIVSMRKDVVHDGPFVETKEMVGGYYVFTAADWDEAIEVAKGCPTFDHGGEVELRVEMDYS